MTTAAKLDYNGMKRHFDDAVYYEAKAAKIPALGPGVTVTFGWHEPDRRRDPDNVRGGAKFVLDGLVKAGVLSDDGPDWVRGFGGDVFFYPGTYGYHGPGVDVELWRPDVEDQTLLVRAGRLFIPVRLPGTNEQGAARELGARKSVYRRNKRRGRR